MEENKYSRRDFLSKKLLKITVVAGGTAFFGLKNLVSLAADPTQGKPRQTKLRTTKTVKKTTVTKTTKKTEPVSTHPCDDMTGIPAAELEKRKKLAYVSKSSVPDKQCNNCGLYLKPKPDVTCGNCALFKGPVRPEGACAYWAPISEG